MVLPRVVKGSGEREPYSEEKLRNGMLRALEKRPVATEAIDAAVQRIRQHLLALGEREVASRLLGEWVMVELRELDQVGYVRFASVYRSFQDVSDFREELERLEGQPSPELRRQQIPLPLSEDKS
jgi:transcriptional repressor NrdR